MTKDEVLIEMLKIIKEVSDGPKENYFYPMGGPSIRLVSRVIKTMKDYEEASEDEK